jgi:LysM repeat protein
VLFLGLAVSGSLSLLSAPNAASANFLTSLLQKTAPVNTSDTSYNSQTVPLLAAAASIDPSATPSEVPIVNGEALESQDNPLRPGDTATPLTNPQISVYKVRAGDTLSSIAKMFGVDTNTIVGANNIKNRVIHPGEELIILPITGIRHTVLKGETLAGLEKTYHSNAHDIALYNNLSDDATLVPGVSIIIPNAEVPAPAPAKTVTKSKSSSTTKVTKTKGFKPAPLRNAGGPEYDGYYDWPVGGGIITQSLHGYNGVDIGAPTGTDMYASAAGTVIVAKSNGAWNGGYGNYIVIQHNNGTQTLYAHASAVLVSPGDSVSQGELIGRVGRTGESTGPHLHFEIRGATNPFGALPVGSGN